MRLSIIGAGNVGTHYAKEFYKAGLHIDNILSRRYRSARKLADAVKAKATTSFSKLASDSDVYIIAVPDDIISWVSEQLSQVIHPASVVLHTSGASNLQLLKKYFLNTGFAWPPQSISKKKVIDFKVVPICIGASNQNTQQLTKKLFLKISTLIYTLSDQQKLKLHLSAVFVNNFANHLFQIAFEICKNESLDFALLYPIIQETAAKIIGNEPAEVQTGPAIRNDQQTLKKHLAQLKADPMARKIYQIITKSIQERKS